MYQSYLESHAAGQFSLVISRGGEAAVLMRKGQDQPQSARKIIYSTGPILVRLQHGGNRSKSNIYSLKERLINCEENSLNG
jgi:hypothetical protein